MMADIDSTPAPLDVGRADKELPFSAPLPTPPLSRSASGDELDSKDQSTSVSTAARLTPPTSRVHSPEPKPEQSIKHVFARPALFDLAEMWLEGWTHPYSGLLTAAGMGLALNFIVTAYHNYLSTGHTLHPEILAQLFRPQHTLSCLLTDVVAYYAPALWNVPLQRAIQRGTISWNGAGWKLQAVWEVAFIGGMVAWIDRAGWGWVQRVFMTLHLMVMAMKQHSYAVELAGGDTSWGTYLWHLHTPSPTFVPPSSVALRPHVRPQFVAIHSFLSVFYLLGMLQTSTYLYTALFPIPDIPTMVLPMTILYCLSFLLIWTSLLPLLAELTRYPDRRFFGPWWNADSWAQFSRTWNTPVHRWLRKYVYEASGGNVVGTYVLSAVAHEVVMWAIFGGEGEGLEGRIWKWPYLMGAMMTQLVLPRAWWVIWAGVWLGPSVLCWAYLGGVEDALRVAKGVIGW